MEFVVSGAFYYDKEEDVIVTPRMTGCFYIVDCSVYERMKKSESKGNNDFVKYQGQKYFDTGIRPVSIGSRSLS